MNRGDVALVNWPYSDQTGSKLRPAVVVQADFLNGILDDTVLVQITSNRHGIPRTEVELDPAQETNSGLLHVSYVFGPDVLTEEQAQINQTIGYLSGASMQKIEDCLKTVLALP